MKLREWQCVAPPYWSEPQLAEYIQMSTVNLSLGMAPVVQICSPLGAANVLLAVLASIAVVNGSWIPQILDSMASVAESLEESAANHPERMH